jgi:hypothetical protein
MNKIITVLGWITFISLCAITLWYVLITCLYGLVIILT